MMFYLLFSSSILVLIIMMWLFPQIILPVLILSVSLQRYNLYIEKIRFSLKFIIIFLPVVAIILLVKKGSKLSDFLFEKKKLIFCSIILLVGITFSLFGSINMERSLFYLVYMCLLLFFVFIISVLVKKKKDYWKALNSIILTGAAVSVVGIIQFLLFQFNMSVAVPFENYFSAKTISAESFVYRVNDTDYLRPSSTFVDVNITAGFLAVVVLLNLGYLIYWFNKEKLKKIVFYSLLFIINIVAFSMTVSRSAFLGIFFAMLFFIIINREFFKNKKVLLCTSFFIVLAGIATILLDTPLDAFYNRIITTFFEHDVTGSTQEHIRFSMGAWKSFLHRPLNGVGAGNFEEYYLTRIDPSEDTAYSYNIYLNFLAETGVIGFISQITFIFFIIRSSLLTIKKLTKEKEKLLFSGLFCSYIALLIANFFYAYYILFFVWLVIGLLIAGNRVLDIDRNNL